MIYDRAYKEDQKKAREDAKEGDKVHTVTTGNWHGPSYQPNMVARTTKKWVILENGDRYRKSDGRRVGDSDSWYGHEIVMHTEIGERVIKKHVENEHHHYPSSHQTDFPYQDSYGQEPRAIFRK